ncbi:hypothetical protein ACTHOQ_06260 [Solibacillus silvestris]|uniref:hypothetical protein n=1 Tax=Solibacillus silvestris TaxID=76853 RepID=UPI003F7E4EC2
MQDLYSSSLVENDAGATKSYNIGGLFLVAFFGGIIGVSVLGIQNAKWLRLDKKYIQGLIAVSTVLFILKVIVVYAIAQQAIAISLSNMDNIAKLFGVLCYIIYFLAMKKPFKEHLAVGGGTEVLYKKGIVWVLISGVIESMLIMLSKLI